MTVMCMVDLSCDFISDLLIMVTIALCDVTVWLPGHVTVT